MSLRVISVSLATYYKGASRAEKVILESAFAAAAACAVGGAVPILALPSLIISCIGAVWTMYYRICKELGIPLSGHMLRFLGTAALSNIAANLVGTFAAELLTMAIPGLGSVAGAAATFACVYLAGMMFMNVILSLAQNGHVGDDVGDVSKRTLKDYMNDATPSEKDVKDAKSQFERGQK